MASRGTPQLQAARRLLLIPDLLAYWLTGVEGAEITNASTTQLLDVTRRQWAAGLIRRLGLDPGLFPRLREPGDPAGELRPAVLEAAGLAGPGQGPVPVTAVGTHDTASAVAGVPAEGERFAYISCGTWALVGVELDRPVLSDESRQANFTNELGVGGTIRYLRNTMGLWLLQESLRTWAAATVRCVVDSLALAFRRTLHDAQRLSGRDVEVVHLVGGGARHELLCQLVADVCELPVVAGPVEATALGNLLVQARAHGAAPDDLTGQRALLRRTQPLRTYLPGRRITTEIPR